MKPTISAVFVFFFAFVLISCSETPMQTVAKQDIQSVSVTTIFSDRNPIGVNEHIANLYVIVWDSLHTPTGVNIRVGEKEFGIMFKRY